MTFFELVTLKRDKLAIKKRKSFARFWRVENAGYAGGYDFDFFYIK